MKLIHRVDVFETLKFTYGQGHKINGQSSRPNRQLEKKKILVIKHERINKS